MTLPPVIRVFFAIDLPLTAKAKLGNFIGVLKKKSKSNAIRWTRAENLHVTLQFLPEVQVLHLPKLIAEVRRRVEGSIKNATLQFGTLHVFPNPYRPRVIVLDVTSQDHLTKLAELIGEGIKSANYEVENRPFRGHLTLGRIKQPQEVNLQFLTGFTQPEVDNIELKAAVLFRSEPQQEGSMYTVIEKIALEPSHDKREDG